MFNTVSISQMMNSMGGEDDLPNLGCADDVSIFSSRVTFKPTNPSQSRTYKAVVLHLSLICLCRMSLQIAMTRVSEPLPTISPSCARHGARFHVNVIVLCHFNLQKCQTWNRRL